VPDDVGGQPFPDGEEPEYHHHGAADDEFASVVLDEDFVRSAVVHEPTAVERILAAAQSHGESETARGFEDGYGYGAGVEGEFELDVEDLDAADADVIDEDDPDEEGRFDRSDYTEYVELADGDEYGPYDSLGTFTAYGDIDQYDSQFRQYNQFENYSQFGIYRRYDPRLEFGEEHGSDYRRPHRRSGKHSASARTYRGHARWQRPVAWVLAVVMGIGMVALALSAIYRGTSQHRQDPTPRPATTGVDSSAGEREGASGPKPSTSPEFGAPTLSAQPRHG
jgi:hypothetical protein